MNKKYGNKTFTECKISTTFQKKDFLTFLRFWTANSKEFHSTMSYLWSKWTAKTYEIKDFSLANDAETHSSTKEENKKEFLFIYLSASKARKGKYRQAKNQEKQFWLKAQIAKNRIKKSHNSNCKNNDSHTCLKTVKFLIFWQRFKWEKVS